ncbi:MAG: cytochrome c [Rhodospirillaceae bacterium]
MAGSPRRSDSSSGRTGAAVAAIVAAGLVLVTGLTPLRLAAADRPEAASPELIRVIGHRQAELRRLGAAMRVIGRFLKSEGANVADVGASAEVIRAVAGVFNHEQFPEGTAIGAGRSAARLELWQEWDIFRERATALRNAAGRLVGAAATGNADAVRAPILAVSQACGACHELFRRTLP